MSIKGQKDLKKLNLLQEQVKAIYEFVKAHPGCTRFEITMELGLLDTEFRKARIELGDRIYSKSTKEGSSRGGKQSGFYITEET